MFTLFTIWYLIRIYLTMENRITFVKKGAGKELWIWSRILIRRHICVTLLVHLRCIQTQMLLPLSCGYTQSPSKPGLSGCLLLISSSFAEFPLQMLTVFQRLLELRLFCEEQNLSPLKTSALELCQLQISHIKYKVLDRSFAIICNLVNIFHWIGSSI